jgi:hypothetical protein
MQRRDCSKEPNESDGVERQFQGSTRDLALLAKKIGTAKLTKYAFC